MVRFETLVAVAFGLIAFSISSAMAQEWTLAGPETRVAEKSCIATSPQGLLFWTRTEGEKHSLGFLHVPFESFDLPRQESGTSLEAKALVFVDFDFLLHSTVRVEFAEKADGTPIQNMYIAIPDFGILGKIKQGNRLHLQVGVGLQMPGDLKKPGGRFATYDLAGSSKAGTAFEDCTKKMVPPRPSIEPIAGPLADAPLKCDMLSSVFYTESEIGRRIVYFDDRKNSTSTRWGVFFELWKDDAMVARMYGNMVSSQGASTTYVSVLSRYYSPEADPDGIAVEADPGIATAVMEQVFVEDSDAPAFLVLAGLNQQMWNRGSDHIEFFAPVEDEDHAFAGSNVFYHDYCRKKPVALSPPPKLAYVPD